MTDTQALRNIIQSKGLKLGYVAEACGLKRATFMRRMNNKSAFRASDIPRICEVLGLSDKERDRIFFADHVS